jgi:hypothetical protein
MNFVPTRRFRRDGMCGNVQSWSAARRMFQGRPPPSEFSHGIPAE